MGPGLITACADNDAGGITTYSVAGASFGYSMLWMLFLITFTLGMVQEMAARMGAVTHKGLGALIREEYGVKVTVFALTCLLIANIATTIANFAGIAASLKIFGVSKYISVPIAAISLWFLVVRESYKRVEKIFLWFCLLQITYVISGFLVHPPWKEVLKQTFIPSFKIDKYYLLIFIGTIGTTITPWMQYYLQSSIVDKGIKIKDYRYEKWDVIIGAFITDFVSFFIIVCTAATLFANKIHIETAADAALALQPLAGKYCTILFAVGLLNASLLTASILPLSTAYAVTEAFGWEHGVSKSFKTAPVFFGVYTFCIVVGAGAVLLPNISLVHIMLVSQQVNGIILPVILVLMLLLINNKRIMGKYINGPIYNLIVWVTTIALIILTALLLFTSFVS
jgi:Mn2+/Fe2+ NRAMP family transporter